MGLLGFLHTIFQLCPFRVAIMDAKSLARTVLERDVFKVSAYQALDAWQVTLEAVVERDQHGLRGRMVKALTHHH